MSASRFASTLEGPAEAAAAVTPSDVTNLTPSAKALYVGGAGDISLVTLAGDEVTLVGVPAGTFVPIRVARVNSTSTTATSIVALW